VGPGAVRGEAGAGVGPLEERESGLQRGSTRGLGGFLFGGSNFGDRLPLPSILTPGEESDIRTVR
jgi:hypothetical protein